MGSQAGYYLRAQCRAVQAHSRHCALNRARHILAGARPRCAGHRPLYFHMDDLIITAHLYSVFGNIATDLFLYMPIMADQCITGTILTYCTFFHEHYHGSLIH